jgi:hypothetical protein
VVEFERANKMLMQHHLPNATHLLSNGFDIHVAEMAKETTWGTDTELMAIAILLDVNVWVFHTVHQKWGCYGPPGSDWDRPGIYLRNTGDTHFECVVDAPVVVEVSQLVQVFVCKCFVCVKAFVAWNVPVAISLSSGHVHVL